MKAKLLSAIVCGMLAIASLSSCCSYTNAVAISSEAPMGTKKGTSSQWRIFGIIGVGGPRQSIQAAANDGRITKVMQVEHHNKTYFGIVNKHRIVVYGE